MSAGVVAVVAMSACTGAGVGQRFQSTTIGKYDGALLDPDVVNQGETSLAMRSNSLALYDTSGILLAVLGTAANKMNARDEALRKAIERGDREFSYSYRVLTPIPGNLTTLRVGWADGSGATNTGLPMREGAIEYLEVDFTTTLHDWALPGGCDLAWIFQTNFQRWRIRDTMDPMDGSPTVTFGVERIALPSGVAVGKRIVPILYVYGQAMVDPFVGLLNLVLGDEERPHWLDASLAAGASWSVTRWLNLRAEASANRMLVDTGKRTGDQVQLNLYAVVFWR